MSWGGVTITVLVAAGAYGALVLYLYLNQAKLLYFPDIPSRAVTATPEAVGLAYEPVNITTVDGLRLEGWFVPAAQDPPRAVLLFFHGNAGNIAHRLDSLAIFHRLGLASLIFDYRGYGRSEGSPSEDGTYRDAQAAWRYMVEQRHIAPRDLVYFGRSLGAAIAAHLAVEHPPRALLLESAFTSVPDLAADVYPFLPVRRLARFRYDTENRLRTLRCPVLVIHSRDDEIIPFAHGKRLYGTAAGPKRLLVIRGSHNEGFLASGRDYIEGLDAFLREHLGG